MRKVLSFVLVLSLVLGSFSMAFAATPGTGFSDMNGEASAEAVSVLSDLGVVSGYPDGEYKPENIVTRAEMSVLVIGALGLTDYVTTTAKSSFPDMAGYGWAEGYIAYAESLGILSGYPDGTFKPGNTVTYDEVCSMLVRALGYTTESLPGSWPANFVVKAKALGILDGIQAGPAGANRGDVAIMLYQTLDQAIGSVNKDGEWKASAGDNMLTRLGAEYVPAAVIRGDEASVINLKPYIGAFAVTYLNDDDEIIAVGEIESTFLTVDKIVNGTKFKTPDGTEYTYSATSGYAIFTNGELTTSDATTPYTAALGNKLAVELNGKTVTKLWSVAIWTANETVEFEKDMLDDDSLNGWDFALDDDDEIDYNSFELRGVASLDAIAKDNVVDIYVGSVSDEITRVDVGTKTVEGKVTMIDDGKYTIAGKEYKLAPGASAPTLGDAGTASLNFIGKIAFWDIDDAASGNYAIVTGTEVKAGGSTLAYDKIRLVNKSGEELTLEVKNAESYVSGTAIGTLAIGDLVEYSLDKNGRIDSVEEFALVGIGANKLSKSGTLLGNMTVDAGVVVFVQDGTDYTVATLADVEKEATLTGEYYASSKVKVLVVDDSNITGSEAVYAVVNKVVDAYNADGDKVQYVTGFANGKEFKAYTDDTNTVTYTTAVGIYKISLNSDNVITKATSIVASATGIEDFKAIANVKAKDGTYLVQDAADNKWYSLDSAVKVYKYDAVKGEFDTSNATAIKGQTTAVPTGSAIDMYQVDKDSEKYDIVIIR